MSTTQVHRIYIKASAQAIWDAITTPEWSARYGYGSGFESPPTAGAPYRMLTTDDMKKYGAEQGFEVPDVAVDGEVLELHAPRRLVLTWRMFMDEASRAEGFTKLTYEIDEVQGGYSKLTVIHDLEGAPTVAMMTAGDGPAEQGGGGWPWVLSDLKSLLETGTAFTAP